MTARLAPDHAEQVGAADVGAARGEVVAGRAFRRDRLAGGDVGDGQHRAPVGRDLGGGGALGRRFLVLGARPARSGRTLPVLNPATAEEIGRAAYAGTDDLDEALEAAERGFPLVHAVGMGSDRPPCLIDMRWGAESDPKVTLVGKGIVFDTGGLDIKPAAGMLTMKKDMGGAANVLGLASMIMAAGLKVRLRVVIPAAENSIGGRAFRPGDILKSRKGLTVEIGNTDAEGRLVLADALAFADEEAPELLIAMATLTGAALVALGPDLPPFYTDDPAFAAALEAAATAVRDPVWRMPFWAPYDAWLASKIADLNNVASNSFAGSIVAALFLRRFVSDSSTFAHFDIFGWSPTPRAIGPEGGEAQAIRGLFRYLGERYG